MLKNKRGFTLVEMLVICAIIAIAVTIAFPNLRVWIAKEDLKKAARELRTELRKIQVDAMKNGYIVGLAVSKTGFTVSKSNGDTYTFDFPTDGVSVSWEFTDGRDIFFFTGEGMATYKDGDTYKVLPWSVDNSTVNGFKVQNYTGALMVHFKGASVNINEL